jgi:acyl-CoA reductase-like NAD-dependent aldehyde dehydrogenase
MTDTIEHPPAAQFVARSDAFTRMQVTRWRSPREGIFGLVLVAQSYKNVDDLAARANHADYGLAAYV